MATITRGKYQVTHTGQPKAYRWAITRKSKGQTITLVTSRETFTRTDAARRSLRSLVKGIAADLGLDLR